MNKDEILKIADQVHEKAQRDKKTSDIESAIIKIKHDIYQKVEADLTGILMLSLMAKEQEMPVFGRGHVAAQIAECAEIIMRRAWIEEA